MTIHRAVDCVCTHENKLEICERFLRSREKRRRKKSLRCFKVLTACFYCFSFMTKRICIKRVSRTINCSKAHILFYLFGNLFNSNVATVEKDLKVVPLFFLFLNEFLYQKRAKMREFSILYWQKLIGSSRKKLRSFLEFVRKRLGKKLVENL